MSVRRVALLTAGGFAPCLSSAVGGLIERYTEIAPDIEIIAYEHGYYGLLRGDKIVIDDETRAKAGILHKFGGSPIGNSRVKLTNAADCVKRGLVQEGAGPAAGRGRAAQGRRRRRAAHHRWRRHEHDRRGPRRLPARQRLRADGRRPAQDDRQRRGADQAVAGRLDRRRGGRRVRREHHRRAPLRPAHAHRARGHGPALRLAHRRRGRRLPQVARHAGVGARASA